MSRKIYLVAWPVTTGASPEIFQAGEFSWDQSTFINNHIQGEKEKPRREKSPGRSPGNS